jgi:hypothetical protein
MRIETNVVTCHISVYYHITGRRHLRDDSIIDYVTRSGISMLHKIHMLRYERIFRDASSPFLCESIFYLYDKVTNVLLVFTVRFTQKKNLEPDPFPISKYDMLHNPKEPQGTPECEDVYNYHDKPD